MKKRHHYIPECYLKNFVISADEPQLFIFEKGKNNPPFFKTNPKKVGVIGHYYTFKKDNSQRDSDTLENMFCRAEERWSDLINKFQSHEVLCQEDADKICTFIALMRIRVPNFRLQIEHG